MGDVNGGRFKSFVADLQQAKRLLLTITSCKQARESALPCIYCNGPVWEMEKPLAAIVRLLLEPTTWKRISQNVIDVFIDFLDYLTSCISTMAVKCVFKASLKFLIRSHIYVSSAHTHAYWNISSMHKGTTNKWILEHCFHFICRNINSAHWKFIASAMRAHNIYVNIIE